MSKQSLINDLLDLKRKIDRFHPDNITWNNAISHCVGAVNTSMEGMVIVPEDPTEDMLIGVERSYFMADASELYVESDVIDNYKIMINTAKEQS